MNCNLIFLVFLAYSTSLFAEEGQDALSAQPICIAREAAPCAFVNNVHVVDGGLYLSMNHMKVPGHVPLDLVQYYNNKSNYSSWFGTGMTLNYCFWIQGIGDVKSGHDYDGVMAESYGGSIISCIAKGIEEGSQKFYLDPAVIHKGFTNCGAGSISARTNLKNCYIKEKIVDDENEYYKWTCYLPDGTTRYYKRAEDRDDLVVVKEEIRRNLTRLEFDHAKRDFKQDSIREITAKGRSTFNRLEFARNNKKRKAKVKSSNGKVCRFSSFKKYGRHYIEKIESTDSPTYEFRYTKAGKYYSINRIELPDGRYLELDYDKEARVVKEKAPVGKDGEKRTIYSFDYHDDYTVVHDANQNKKIYRHHNNRISDIEEYKGHTLYRVKSYYWGKKEGLSWGKQPTGKEGNLLGYATLNHEKCATFLRYFDYDDYGNIVRETTAGNLSGNYPWAFWVDDEGRPKDQNVERYQKYYTYSKDHLLIGQSEDFGPRIEYEYKSGTDLVSAKFIKDSDKIVKREFYTYDDNGILIEKTIDDGTSPNKSELAGVSMRLVTKIVPTVIGLPQDIYEYYLDLTSKNLVSLKQTHYNYNKAGEVVEEAIFDSEGTYRYSSWYEYDHKGRLHKKKDPIGQIYTYVYDNNDNKTYEKREDAQAHTIYKYDAANRLIDSTEYHYDNTKIAQQFEYDLMGNKIRSYDRYGNITTYHYDECNRLIETILPKKSFSVKKEYDLFDNVSSETNEKHAKTSTEYTVRNKPARITYPDASVERFQYNKKGTLFKKWDKSGTRYMYHYDKFDRVTKEYVHDADGNKLLETENCYNSFHLLSSKNPRGHTTYFRYDGAGRLIEELLETPENYTKKCFSYDSLGRLSSTKHYYGKERDTFYEVAVEYDNLDRILSEKELDSTGICHSETVYEYNADGMLTRKEKAGVALINRYNSKKELIETIDEEGFRVEISYNHTFTNHKGQRTLQKVTRDGLNNLTEEYFDELGRCISILRKNANGELTHVTDYRYSPTGKKIREKNRVFFDGILERDYVVSYKYDLQDRLIRLVEEPQSEEKKETSYTYDLAGRIETIQKPNGLLLKHSYDPLGRLSSLTSSDKTISYRYSYDRNSNPRKIVDEVHGITTKRVYDAWNRLIRDGIEDVYTMKMRYDSLGRIKKAELPDGSSIAYLYDDMHLKKIERFSKEKGLLYSHCYTAYDVEHRPVAYELINNLGTCTLSWDKKGRNKAIFSPYHIYSVDALDAVGNITSYSFEDPEGKVSVHNSYDDLYQLQSEEGYKNHTYSHDSLHNRRKVDDAAYTLDCHNRIISDENETLSYDKNGNPTSFRNQSYKYDALDRLIEVTDGDTVTKYLYDSFNRRIKKNDDFYIYQDLREIGLLKNGELAELRVLGIGKAKEIGAQVALELAGKLYCPLHDFRGNITLLIDAETKEIAQTIRYTAFGEAKSSTSLFTPWQFASKRYDPETDLLYFHSRYYAPELGRFFTADPAGFADGPNLYAYVHNNPLSHFDLFGLLAEPDKFDNSFSFEERLIKESHAFERDFFSPQSRWMSVGNETVPGIHIWAINGMFNSEEDAEENFSYLADLGNDVKVLGLYNASHGVWDITEGGLLTRFGITSYPSKMLAKAYNKFHKEQPPHSKILQCSHSIGSGMVKRALEICDPEVRNRVISIAIGPAMIIPPEYCYKSDNYISKCDWVGLFSDPFGQMMYQDSIHYLTPHKEANLCFDHNFTSDTYNEPLHYTINNYIEKYRQ